MRRLGPFTLFLAGIAVITQAVLYLFEVITTFPGFGYPVEWLDMWPFYSSVFAVLLLMALGTALIWNRNRLADRLFEDSELKLAIDAVSLLRVGLIVLGIFIGIEGIQRVIFTVNNWAYQIAYAAAMEGAFEDPVQAAAVSNPGWVWSVTLGLFLGMLQIGISALLVLRSERVAGRLWSLPAASATESVRESTLCPTCGTEYDPDDYRDLSTARCTECHAPLLPKDA